MPDTGVKWSECLRVLELDPDTLLNEFIGRIENGERVGDIFSRAHIRTLAEAALILNAYLAAALMFNKSPQAAKNIASITGGIDALHEAVATLLRGRGLV